MTSPPAERAEGTEFRLVVWTTPGLPWRARVVGADDSERDFANPFELARFLAWPTPPQPGKSGRGLR